MKTAQNSPKVQFSLLITRRWTSTVFPSGKNARDCTDKGGACEAEGAWLNYYIKSIRRLGRGPDIPADLGEKSGMTGSCERDACGSARPEVDTARSFAAHCSDSVGSGLSRQGISSTDKDVTVSDPRKVCAGGFSSPPETVPFLGAGQAGSARPRVHAIALVDGRYERGLDSGAVSVKLPLGVQDACAAHRAVLACAFPDAFRTTEFAAPRGRRRGGGRSIIHRIKEALPLLRRQPAWMEGTDPVAARRRTPKGNKAGLSCFMRTSGATSA